MLFNTLDFIIFFVIILAAISIWKYRKFQHLFIILSSFFFLYYTDNYLVTLLIFTILLHFYVGKGIYHAKSIIRKKTIAPKEIPPFIRVFLSAKAKTFAFRSSIFKFFKSFKSIIFYPVLTLTRILKPFRITPPAFDFGNFIEDNEAWLINFLLLKLPINFKISWSVAAIP